MAEYFGVVEIVKPTQLDVSEFTHYEPFIVYSQMTTDPAVMAASYFSTVFGASDETNKEVLNSQAIIRDLIYNYTQMSSLADCRSNEQSFYFDFTNQILYIHVEHDINFFAHDWKYGKTFGYTTDKVRNFQGFDYLPMVKTIPNLSRSVDPIHIGKSNFWGGDITFNNMPIDNSTNAGLFDGVTNLSGHQINILHGKEGDDYSDLIGVTKNFIDKCESTLQEFKVITKDMRERESIKIPVDTFELADYPSLDPDKAGKIKPLAWGYKRGVPGICTNELAGAAVNKVWYFSPFTAITAYKKVNNLWTACVPVSSDATAGTITLSVADSHEGGLGANGLNEIMAIGTFINAVNPAEQIVDMNSRFLSISYNSSNYNTAEWVAESAYLADSGYYLGDAKDYWAVIEELQNASNVNFFYFHDYGQRTMRINNPNRAEVDDIEAVELLNNGVLPVDQNQEQFATHAVIKYNQHIAKNEWLKIENRDYYDIAFANFWREKQYPSDQEGEDAGLETQIVNQSDAEDKGTIIMEDQSEVRPIFTLQVAGSDFYSLRIFDIINAEISYPGVKVGDEYAEEDVIVDAVVGAEEEVIFTDDDTETDIEIVVDWAIRDIIEKYREYYGWQRLQIIGLKPDLLKGQMEITARQRDYSDEWDLIFP